MAGRAKAFELVGEIVVDPRKAVEGLRTVERQAKATASSIGKMSATMGGGGAGGGGLFSSIGEGLKMLPGIGILAGGLTKVFDVMQGGVKMGFDYRRMIEENSIAFEVMLGSAQKAGTLLRDLARFAETSPFEFSELVPTTKRMLAMGFAVKEIVPSLRVVSDAASALGTDLDGIVLALGQMRQKTFQFEEANQLIERGIPVWDILSKAIGKTTQETMKLAEARKISGKGAAQAILIGMQKQFGGLGQRYATETAGGLEANLNDVVTRLLGTSSGPFFERYKKLLKGTLDAANSETASALSRGIAGAGDSAFNTLDAALKVGGNIGTGLVSTVGPYGAKAAQMFMDAFEGPGGTDAHSPAKAFVPIGERAAEGFKIGFLTEMDRGGGIMALFAGGGGRVTPPSTRGYLEQLLTSEAGPRIKAFFEAIRKAEGGRPNLIVGGKRTFDPSGDHPNVVGLVTSKGPSTAAGSYQITGSNWYGRRGQPGLKSRLGATSFDEQNQLLAAMMLFNDRAGGAGMSALLGGDINSAMKVAALDWTSTPGSKIGGGGQVGYGKWMGYFNQAMRGGGGGGGPVPVRIVGPDPISPHAQWQSLRGAANYAGPISARTGRGDLTGGVGVFVDAFPKASDAAEVLEDSISTINTEIGRTIELLPSLPIPFREAAGEAAGLNEELQQTEPILIQNTETAAAMFKRLGETMKGEGRLNWEEFAEDGRFIFQQFFMDLENGWKGALASMGMAFIQSMQQMAAQALANQVWGMILRFAGAVLTGGIGGIGGAEASGSGFGGAFGSLVSGKFASGTLSAPRGLALVGEQGPELIGLRGGERIYSNDETRGMLGGAANVTIHVHGVTNPAQFLSAPTQNQIQRKYRKALQAVR